MPKLIIEKGDNKDLEITVGKTVFAGRDSSAHILLAEPMISRLHFKIERRAEGYFLMDLNSLNGTFVNRARVKERLLKPGDMIQVGDTIFSFISDDPGNQQKSLVGQIVGGYSVLERVGRGGMGTVYKALQISLNRAVALKILAPEMLKDKTFVDMFLREARSAAQMNHHNIVQVYDVGRTPDDVYYFSMEFMPGGSIQELLMKKPRLPLLQATRMMLDATSGLSFAEKKLIVHRDIKPDNLMLSEDGSVKIVDLGLATFMESAPEGAAPREQKQSQSLMGTPHYLSPEQAQGKPVDHRSDIYSLGASFYRIISGATPYSAPSVKELIAKKLREEPRPLKELLPVCPDSVVRIINRMMRLNRDERYQNASELLKDLRRLQDELEPSDKPVQAVTATVTGKPVPEPSVPARADEQLSAPERVLRHSLSFRFVVPAALALMSAMVLFFIVYYYFSDVRQPGPIRGVESPPLVVPDTPTGSEHEEKLALEYLNKARVFERSLSGSSTREAVNSGIRLYEKVISDCPRSRQVKPAQEGVTRLNLLLKSLDDKAALQEQEHSALESLVQLELRIEAHLSELRAQSNPTPVEKFVSESVAQLSDFSRQFPRFPAVAERVESKKTALGKWYKQVLASGDAYQALVRQSDDLVRQGRFAAALKSIRAFIDNPAYHQSVYDNAALDFYRSLESAADSSFADFMSRVSALKELSKLSEALGLLESAAGSYGLPRIENRIKDELAWFKTQQEALYRQSLQKESELFPAFLASLFWSLQSGRFDDWEHKASLIDLEFQTKEYHAKLAEYAAEMRFEKGIIDRYVERFNQRRIDQPIIQNREIFGIDTANGIIYLKASGLTPQRLVKFQETSIRDWELCLSNAWSFDARDYFELGFLCVYRGGNTAKAEEYFEKANALIYKAADKRALRTISDLLVKYRSKPKLAELKNNRERDAALFKQAADALYESRQPARALEAFQLLRYRYSNTVFYAEHKTSIDSRINILTGK
jgi:serine/threonine protein kinase